MPFSQIIPPSPSATESKRLFYTSASLLLSRIQGYHYHLSKFHIYALVYCIDFAIHQYESSMGIHVFPILNPLPPPSPYHLSGSSQCTSPEHPVSCIEPRLAIGFLHDSIHVSMSFSQIIPPSSSPSESKSPFYTSVSLLLSRIQGHQGTLLHCWWECKLV